MQWGNKCKSVCNYVLGHVIECGCIALDIVENQVGPSSGINYSVMEYN